jgi:3-oxoacyl-[acyl-carrier protein] reductase
MKDLDSKVALVTGSSQGLGRVIAHRLAAEGCTVIVNCASHIEKAQAVVKEITDAGHKAEPCRADVSNEQVVREMFRGFAARYGGIDILVNNARVDPYSRQPDTSDSDWWDRVIQINLKGTYLCSQAFFEQAKGRRWGRIVNVSSVRSFIPAEMHMIAYGVSKVGMHALTRAFAQNGAPYGITANTVAPGVVATENMDKRLGVEMKKTEMAKVPLGRPGTCDEMADGVLFVIKNGYVTGETININGGMYYAP